LNAKKSPPESVSLLDERRQNDGNLLTVCTGQPVFFGGKGQRKGEAECRVGLLLYTKALFSLFTDRCIMDRLASFSFKTVLVT